MPVPRREIIHRTWNREGHRHTVCLATWLASTWGRRTRRWRMPTATPCDDDQPGPIASLPIPQVVAVNDVVGAAAPAVVLVLARGQGVPGGGVRPAVEVAAGPRAGRLRARARSQGAGPAGQLGQELALARRRRPPRSDPALDGRRGCDARSRRSPPRRRISNTCATPGTPESPARRPPTGSRTRRSS